MVDFGEIYFRVFCDCDYEPAKSDIDAINNSLSSEQKEVILSYLKHNLGEDFELFDATLGLTGREVYKRVPIEELKAIVEKKLDYEALYVLFRVTPETALENLSSGLQEALDVHGKMLGGTLDDMRYLAWIGRIFFSGTNTETDLLLPYARLRDLITTIEQVKRDLDSHEPKSFLIDPADEFKDLQF